MSQQELLDGFLSLPAEAQRQVLNLINLLQQRYKLAGTQKRSPTTTLCSYEFIGMWRAREDLADSSTWVRRIRDRV
jgi:hypothetical protein